MREKQKSAAAAKKEKDKQDRINQKSQAEERKKKAQEKSAKGERRSGRWYTKARYERDQKYIFYTFAENVSSDGIETGAETDS